VSATFLVDHPAGGFPFDSVGLIGNFDLVLRADDAKAKDVSNG